MIYWKAVLNESQVRSLPSHPQEPLNSNTDLTILAPTVGSAGNMQSRRMGSQPHSYVQTGRSRTMPHGLTDDRTDSSEQTITFSPNNLRPRFCTWLRYELTRLEDYLKAITLANITNWEEGKNLFGSAHYTLKKILNRTYNELERNINSDRFERYHAAHRFKVKLDISPALNSAKNAQINIWPGESQLEAPLSFACCMDPKRYHSKSYLQGL